MSRYEKMHTDKPGAKNTSGLATTIYVGLVGINLIRFIIQGKALNYILTKTGHARAIRS